jgi:hypothetical protein
MPVFTQGAAAAAALEEEARKNRPGRFRMQTYTIKNDPQVEHFLRFVTDHQFWISADTHRFVPTKDKPAEWDGNWPGALWGICPLDRMFRLPDPQRPGRFLDAYEDGFGQCYIHEAFAGIKDEKFGKDKSVPDPMVWSVAVLREPVLDPATKEVTGFTDKMVEYKEPGEKGATYQIPHLVIVSQFYRYFYAAVKASAYTAQASVCDKDFRVVRKGNTEFEIAPVNVTPDHRPGTDSWQRYTEALDVLKFDLGPWLVERATVDHYRRWFIPGQEPEGGYARKNSNGSGNGAAAAEPEQSQDAPAQPVQPAYTPEQMAGFRAALSGRPAAAAPADGG